MVLRNSFFKVLNSTFSKSGSSTAHKWQNWTRPTIIRSLYIDLKSYVEFFSYDTYLQFYRGFKFGPLLSLDPVDKIYLIFFVAQKLFSIFRKNFWKMAKYIENV